jgi:hypothetical protein
VLRRLSLTVIAILILAVVPAAATLPITLTVVPSAVLEAGSLLLLGIAFLMLAAIARRMLFS